MTGYNIACAADRARPCLREDPSDFETVEQTVGKEPTDDDYEQLLQQAEDDVRSDPDLTDAVRHQMSSDMDSLVEKIQAVLDQQRRN